MKQLKVSEATQLQLDWLVARCEDEPIRISDGVVRFNMSQFTDDYNRYAPSTDWAQGGPIIEREGLAPDARRDVNNNTIEWECYNWRGDGNYITGPTCLIAAMRCYVIGKLGDVVEVPEEFR
jgi:hypothetical protein